MAGYISLSLSTICFLCLELIFLDPFCVCSTMKFLAKELQKLCKSLMLLFFQSLLSSA
uniref:Uncharacterized protein n=1 Tax=Rhizophora mucronata TaxID=61149 RepID=A0A2P2KP94_RHIMU